MITSDCNGEESYNRPIKTKYIAKNKSGAAFWNSVVQLDNIALHFIGVGAGGTGG